MKNNTNQKASKKTFIGLAMVMGIMALAFWAYNAFILNGSDGNLLIDNPTDEDITVQIVEQGFDIPANSHIKINMPKGTYKISASCCIQSETLDLSQMTVGVINPTRAKYVVYNVIYTEKDLTDQFKPYDVEGKEVYSLLGAPVVTDDIFIPDNSMGQGNLNNDLPNNKSYDRKLQDYAYITKIFRLEDFFTFYNQKFNE